MILTLGSQEKCVETQAGLQTLGTEGKKYIFMMLRAVYGVHCTVYTYPQCVLFIRLYRCSLLYSQTPVFVLILAASQPANIYIAGSLITSLAGCVRFLK